MKAKFKINIFNTSIVLQIVFLALWLTGAVTWPIMVVLIPTIIIAISLGIAIILTVIYIAIKHKEL